MKGSGWWLMAGGLALAILSFFLPNTIEAPRTEFLASIGETITTGTQSIYNLPKAQFQMMLLHAGCALFIGGTVLAGLGTITEQLGTAALPTPTVVEEPSVSPAGVVETFTPALTIEEQDEQRRKTRNDTIALVAGIVAVILVILAFASVQSQPPVPSATENSADALANKLEAEAGNMDALARADAARATDSDRDNPFK